MTTRAPATPAYTYDAFLSYSSKDLDFARALHDKLAKAGIRVWFDKTNLTVGTNINTAIEEALDQSRHLIALLSPESLASDWASMERHVALFGDADARRRTVLPVVIRDIPKLPASFRFRQYLKVADLADLDRVLPEILSTLRATAKNPPKPAPPPRPSRSKAAFVLVSRTLAALAALGPVAHLVSPQPFTAQWTTLATPAILALSIGVELTFQKYRAAIVEIAALAASLVYLARMPATPVPEPTLPGADAAPPTAATLASTTTTTTARATASTRTAPAPAPAPTHIRTATSAATADSVAPPAVGPRFGTATCAGLDCTLSPGPSAARVCLEAPASSAALQGIRPVCTLREQGGPSCFRSDAAASVPLTPPITWRLCP